MAEEELPNTRSVDRAVKEMLAPDEIISGRMENGVRVVSVNIAAPPKEEYMGHGVTSLRPVMGESQMEAVKERLSQIERVANVKFEFVNDENPDIVIFNGNGMTGAKGYERLHNGTHVVVLEPRYFEDVLLHELGHAMGLKHPDQDTETKKPGVGRFSGSSLAYNNDGTVMSYRRGRDGTLMNLGDYDIAALQSAYGKPKNTSPNQEYTLAKDSAPVTLYSETPVELSVSSDFDGTIVLPEPEAQGVRRVGGVRLSTGTQIQNVTFDPNHPGARIVGNSLDNVLQGGGNLDVLDGGDGDDRLIAVGEKDELRGGAGRDSFVLQPNAQKVVIADMQPGESLVMPAGTQTVLMQQVLRKGELGTKIFARDEQNNLVASAFVSQLMPDEIEGAIPGADRIAFNLEPLNHEQQQFLASKEGRVLRTPPQQTPEPEITLAAMPEVASVPQRDTSMVVATATPERQKTPDLTEAAFNAYAAKPVDFPTIQSAEARPAMRRAELPQEVPKVAELPEQAIPRHLKSSRLPSSREVVIAGATPEVPTLQPSPEKQDALASLEPQKASLLRREPEPGSAAKLLNPTIELDNAAVTKAVPVAVTPLTDEAIQKAVNALKKLDIGYDENVRNGSITTAINGQKVSDNQIGVNEMARISDTATSGYGWGDRDLQASRQRREELQKAFDLNGDGSTSSEEIAKAAEAAKKAGMKFDATALETVLQTNNIPSLSNPHNGIKR